VNVSDIKDDEYKLRIETDFTLDYYCKVTKELT